MTRCMLRLARSVVETRHVANMAFKRIGRGGPEGRFYSGAPHAFLPSLSSFDTLDVCQNLTL